MKNRVSVSDSVLTYRLSGELDHHSAKAARELIDTLIQQQRPAMLRLDFSDVGFMDSSGIGLIMGRYRMMKLYGGKMSVVSVPDELKRIMKLSGLGALGVMEEKGEAYESAE